MKKHGITVWVIGTAFSERKENHTLLFLLKPYLQWRREKSGYVGMVGRERIPFFQLQKVCLPHVSCPSSEMKTSLYRRHVQP
ncbi:hypothetical protein Hanom_Chr06g00482811 [Helianthus anomalus]